MIRMCLISVCRTVPQWVVAPSPPVAGVVGAGACGTHVTRVMRMTMVEHSTDYVRVRLMGAEVASDDGPVRGDRDVGGDA